MNDFFSLPRERAEFSDAIYSSIGRGLTFATQFEANCRTLALLVGVKNRVISDVTFSLSRPEDLDALVNDLQKKRGDRFRKSPDSPKRERGKKCSRA
jgi:hypothetical protein